ncbi:MAG: MFS transporter [Rhodospirillaceae bacterium]|mgnify:FL=1|jgi:MFS family permease|nr:MFS transporter [Rhodospirillaceae bacterium]MBT6286538.1 MFS transporter [Rhodospirillaceae bacterium]
MTSPTSTDWRTPFVILLAGTTIVFLSLGARMTFGLWMPDASFDLFGPNQLKILSLSIALQSLFWGIGTPVAGNIADKYGTGRVIAAAGILYSIGLVMMTVSTTPFMAHLSIGVFTGFAMSGAMFPIILSAISRAVSPEKRNLYLGIASAGGSSGQVLMIPMGQYFIDSQGWIVTLYILAAVTALIVPLAFVMMTRKAEAQTGPALQVLTTGAAIREAFGHRGYVLLTGGYFVCGLQTMFIGTHFPNMLTSLKVDATIAALSLSLIGAFNILGTFTWGAMGGKFRQKYLLCWLYSLRSLVMIVFILMPITSTSVLVFSALMGLLWLGTVPLTGSIVAQVFGLRHMGMLFGFAFVAHQLGSFIGIYAAGYFFDMFGNYNGVWWAAIIMGLVASVMNYPINDKPIERQPVPQGA